MGVKRIAHDQIEVARRVCVALHPAAVSPDLMAGNMTPQEGAYLVQIAGGQIEDRWGL
jgi:hypothetical protein